MRILGVQDGHHASACLLEDGHLSGALYEEWLNRRKGYCGFPEKAVSFLLASRRLSPQDIDLVAFAGRSRIVFSPRQDFWNAPLRKIYSYLGLAPFLVDNPIAVAFQRHGSFIARRQEVRRRLKAAHCSAPEVFIGHHTAHAHGALFCAPRPEGLIVTVDGSGDGCSHATYIVGHGRVKRIRASSSYNSCGFFYESITQYLSHVPFRDEEEVVVLSCRGERDVAFPKLKSFLSLSRDRMAIRNTGRCVGYTAIQKYKKVLCGYSREDVAAGAQRVLEEVITELLRASLKKTGQRHLFLSGGVFSNPLLNKKILEMSLASSTTISPAAGDAGLCIGAAYCAALQHDSFLDSCRSSVGLRTLYLGPEFNAKDIAKEIRAREFSCVFCRDAGRTTALLLAKGKSVAYFGGRMGFGPHSFGSRSILVPAGRRDIIATLKEKLGYRHEAFLNPATLAPAVADCYRNAGYFLHAGKYMSASFDCRDEAKDLLQPVFLPNGEVRPLFVFPHEHEKLYRVLEEYRKITGLSTVFIADFCKAGEPVVCTPADAMRMFVECNLDYLVMENFLLSAAHADEVEE